MKSVNARTQRGIALIVVLWAGVLLGIMAATLAFAARTEVTLAANVRDQAKAQALADAGIQRAIATLGSRARELAMIADGRSYEFALGDGQVRVQVRAETGKLDLNRAPEALIFGLFSTIEAANPMLSMDSRQLSDAVLDWRDADFQRRPYGAEDSDYNAAGDPWGANDRPFLAVSELRRLAGLSAEVFAAIRAHVTVYATSGRIDPSSASREVLLAVPGLDSASVDAFLVEREQLLVQVAENSSEELQLPLHLLSGGKRYLSRSASRVYAILSLGTLSSGFSVHRQAVVRITGNRRKPYTVLAWSDWYQAAEADSVLRNTELPRDSVKVAP